MKYSEFYGANWSWDYFVIYMPLVMAGWLPVYIIGVRNVYKAKKQEKPDTAE